VGFVHAFSSLSHLGDGAWQVVFLISYVALPKEFTGIFTDEPDRVVKNWYMFFCVAVGLWGGLIIGIATEYFTSNRYQPVQVP
jgi:inorganic pyrophosphatase